MKPELHLFPVCPIFIALVILLHTVWDHSDSDGGDFENDAMCLKVALECYFLSLSQILKFRDISKMSSPIPERRYNLLSSAKLESWQISF